MDVGVREVPAEELLTAERRLTVEVAVPFTGSVEPVDDLRVRLQPAQREAVTALTREQARFPRILDAYDAVARWTDDAGLTRTGSPAEVYVGDAAGDGEVFLEVAWPVA
jgi:hypothetical protein